MNKENLELKKAIRDGVAEGIQKGLSGVEVPEVKVCEPSLKAAAGEIKRYCEAQDGCFGCIFYIPGACECGVHKQPINWIF